MYEMVKEQIEKSYQEMKENITPDFIEELKNILKKVTNGKYENAAAEMDELLKITHTLYRSFRCRKGVFKEM